MNNIIILFINISIICFPTLIYILFIEIKNECKIYKKETYFETILYIIVFLIVIFNNINTIYTLTIPLLLSITHNKKYTSIIISIIIILINKSIILSILIIIYFISKTIYNKTTIKEIYYILFYIVLTTIFMIIDTINIKYIIIYLITVIITYLIIDKSYKITNTYKTLYDIKKEKDINTAINKISHEIKNPLVVIKGYLSLNDELLLKEKNNLIKEVNYALNIISDFKDINHLNIKKEYFNIKDLIYEIEQIIKILSNNVKANIKCENINIYADKNRIKQVLINIIKNSIEAKDNITINIDVYKSNKKLIIKIKDNGPGMTKEEINNLFNAFNTKKEYGTGIGLCLCKEIINKHNGSITYSSVINKYTTAKIVLPINSKDKDYNILDKVDNYKVLD